ncbi:2-deoxyribose-5-phosphate aldolase [Desulfoplanes formicivorans]|uniref:Deoxyribose-phosphate aldolase n=1 Tax=Desulfoplanes formicivorans TaxID=1592317 RepID=A0A194AI32_9BACT|nr:2-deoxyribose-5-phosphate aldolase [Desulfoplanes formicivorans]
MELAQHMDHTLLRPDATHADILHACEQSMAYRFIGLCINPCYVTLASRALQGSSVRVISVIGFPLGAQTPYGKAMETQKALENGAREIDMVIHLGALKSREYKVVQEDIATIAGFCHQEQALLKVIIETCLLTDEEKRIACDLCVAGGADMVKTSTGFGAFGATIEDVRLLHELVAPNGLGVKASGGIRILDDALSMLQAGAVRLGTSSGVAIVRELHQRMQAQHTP